MSRFRKHLHVSLAGFMVVWLSGIVFLFCCHAQRTRAAEAEFCPLTKLGVHCDKAEKDKNSLKVTDQTGDLGMDCCAFIPALFDKTRKIESQQQVAVPAPATAIETPKLILVSPVAARTLFYHSIVLSRNDTFLKNRTFRI